MWRPAFELGRGGRLVRAETTAQCVVVACWDSVLRAGRGLERVDRIPVTCARKGTTWKLPGAGGKGRGRTSVLRMHVHRVLVSWATPYVHTLRCVSLPYPLTGVVVAGECCRYIRLHFLLKAQGCLRRYLEGYTAPSPTASQPATRQELARSNVAVRRGQPCGAHQAGAAEPLHPGARPHARQCTKAGGGREACCMLSKYVPKLL